MRIFPEIGQFNMSGLLKSVYEVLNQTAKQDHSKPDHAEPNKGLHQKSSSEVCTLLEYCSV
jgi:hypothetical protein